MIELEFTSVLGLARGTIASILRRSYGFLLDADPVRWRPEADAWDRYDEEIFAHPTTVGACAFLTWSDGRPAGFASYDPRQRPDFGRVGHNCVLPGFRGRGIGRSQVREILGRFRGLGIREARATTLDHPFFIPARRMYEACGFRETERRPWERDPAVHVVDFRLPLAG